MSENTVRVALYSRVSTDMQAGKDEGSLDTQEARLRAFLLSRPSGHEVSAVFREEGQSGKSLDRPALKKMLDLVEQNELDMVLVTRLDRLSRSLLDFYELYRLFEKHNVRFVSLNETFDTSTPVGRAMLKLVLVFAELEREQTAERTRQAMKARAQRGLWNGGSPPLGFDSQGNGHLEVNQAEAELVRLIFDRYLELRSSPKLARWLGERGHRQKRFVSRRRGPTGGRPFSPASVRLMLRNRIYLGEVKHKGDVYEGQHDAIVDRDVFERVQGVIDGNGKNRRGPPLNAMHDYPLTGLLKCSCGYALTTSAGKGRNGKTYFYYRCVGLQKNVDHACEVRQVRAELLEDAVFSVVREAARDPKLLQDAVDEANRMAREQVDPLVKQVENLRRELAEVEAEGQTLLRQVLTIGVGESELARGMLAEVEARQAKLREALATAEGALAGRQTDQLDLELVSQAIRGFEQAFDHLTAAEKREFLQLLIREVRVQKDRVDVDLYDGSHATRFLAQVSRNGHRVDKPKAPNDDRPRTVKSDGFAAGEEWLPGYDHSKNLGAGGRGWAVPAGEGDEDEREAAAW